MALTLNAISPEIGGVLIRGERGTAKSTAARALAALLPEVPVVADCPFNCDPHNGRNMCDNCRARLARGEVLPVEMRRTSFIDLPVSATEDRVVGTLDIERAIKKGERHFEPGVLAAANRGLLYVDEINLLDDHVVDLLLDSAAMGVNVVEREGISFSHPARFILVGTMNPEEGDLRPQLLDRFALCVDIKGVTNPRERMDILERCIMYERSPENFAQQWEASEQTCSTSIRMARELLPQVTYSRDDLATIALLTSQFEVDGHRADIVILKTALAHAALQGRTEIDNEDILVAAELALPHRLKRHPFEDDELTSEELRDRLEQAQKKTSQKAEGAKPAEVCEEPGEKKKESVTGGEETEVQAVPCTPEGQEQPSGSKQEGPVPSKVVDMGDVFHPRRLQSPHDQRQRRLAGRRSLTRSERKRGRYVQSRFAPREYDDIAFDATFRQAAPYQLRRNHGQTIFSITEHDLHRKVRIKRAANLILFVVDASWSMAAAARMEAAKGAVMSLLVDAYQRRDRVGVVVFQKEHAWEALPFTSSVDLARRVLKNIPVGGRTPLSAGLFLAYKMIKRELRLNPELMPLMIVLTDAAANVAMTNRPPFQEAQEVAERIRAEGVRSIVVNMEQLSFDRGLAEELAAALDGTCYNLRELKAHALYQTVQRELAFQNASSGGKGNS